MPYRKIVLAKDQIYHIYNRGVAALPIFHFTQDYQRFLKLIDYYRFIDTPTSFSQIMKMPKELRDRILEGLKKENKAHIKVLTFCLMPNHFHFLLKQLTEKGISVFMSNLQNGYAKYLNIKNDRVGPLFQSMFKAVRITTDEQLVHVSRYIHLNPSTGYLIGPENLLDYEWSSLGTYMKSGKQYPFVKTDLIAAYFKDPDSYSKFILNQADYQRQLDRMKHLILE